MSRNLRKRLRKGEVNKNAYKGSYKSEYYYPGRLFSYDPKKYSFYICIGSRGRGKTVSAWRWVLKRALNHKEKFIWLRLTGAPIQKMAKSSSTTLVPKFLLDQLGIDGIFIKGNSVYINITRKGKQLTVLVGIMDAISTYYTTKGLDLSDYDNVVFDEINRETSERNTFDIVSAFINQVETISRMRNIRILMLGNTTEDTSDILSIFDFQPHEFGIYKLTRRRCIIEYLPDTEEFLEMRKQSLAYALMREDGDLSSFTNTPRSTDENVVPFNQNKPLFVFWISEIKAYGVYSVQRSGKGDLQEGGLYIGEVRNSEVPQYKISPFFNCPGIYSQEIWERFYELISVNRLIFEKRIIRTRFIKALKMNRTSLR